MSARIEIDLDECTNCMTCYKACFIDVIKWDKEKKEPIAAYQKDCVWCFTCEINCPAECLTIMPRMDGLKVDPFI